jgi:Zn-dependent protease with chaperone function
VASIERDVVGYDPQVERITRPLAWTALLGLAVCCIAFPGLLIGAGVVSVIRRVAPVHAVVRWVAVSVLACTAWLLRGALVPFWLARITVANAPWAAQLHITGLASHETVALSVAVEALAGPLAFEIAAISIGSLWNGLWGQMRRQRKAAARQVQAAHGGPDDVPPHFHDGVAGVVRLGIDRQTRGPFDLEPDELTRHIFIPGASGFGKTTTLTRLTDGVLALGYSVAIVDCKGGDLKTTAATLAEVHNVPFHLVDVDDPTTLAYDPCTGTPPDVGNKLSGAFTYSEGASVYKNEAQRILPIIARAIQQKGDRVTLEAIADALDPAGMNRLGRAVGDPLKLKLEGIAAEKGVIEDAHLGLKARLGALTEGRFAPLFDFHNPRRPTLDWDRSLAQPGVTYVVLRSTAASEDVELMGRIVALDLGHVCSRRIEAAARKEEFAPALVMFDEFAALREADQVVPVLRQSRQARMPVVISTQDIPKHPAIRTAALQAGLTIAHRLDSDDAEVIADQCGTKKQWELSIQHHHEEGPTGLGSVRQQDTYRMHPNTIRQLKIGRAAVRSATTDRIAVVQVVPRDPGSQVKQETPSPGPIAPVDATMNIDTTSVTTIRPRLRGQGFRWMWRNLHVLLVGVGLTVAFDSLWLTWLSSYNGYTLGASSYWGWLYTGAALVLIALALLELVRFFVPVQTISHRKVAALDVFGGLLMLVSGFVATRGLDSSWGYQSGWIVALAAAFTVTVGGLLSLVRTRTARTQVRDGASSALFANRRARLAGTLSSGNVLVLGMLSPVLGTPLADLELGVRRYDLSVGPFPSLLWAFVIVWALCAVAFVASVFIAPIKRWRVASAWSWLLPTAAGPLLFLAGAFYVMTHWVSPIGTPSYVFHLGWIVALLGAVAIGANGILRGFSIAPPVLVAGATVGATRAVEAAGALPEQSVQRAREAHDYLQTQLKSVDWAFSLKAMVRYPLASIAALLSAWSGLVYAIWIATVVAFVNGVVFATHGFQFAQSHSFLGIGAKEFGVFAGLFGALYEGANTFVLIYGGQWRYAGIAIVALMFSGVILALTLVVVGMVFERFLLHLRGYRRLSAREARLVFPIYDDVAKHMRLDRVPEVLIVEHKLMAAWAHARHIVITRAFFTADSQDLASEPQQLAAILAHELEHWRRGDPIALGFMQACALPVAFMCTLGAMSGILALVLWPFELLAKYFIAPIFGRESRLYEYQADLAAVRAGYGSGLIDALVTLRILEPGRNGWEQVICATHPATELRIEAIDREMELMAQQSILIGSIPAAHG